MAITDGLTGILNRQEFGRLLEKEMARASRYASPLSLIMYDLDHFKRINDRFGVAEMVPGEDSRSLAQRVDEALYRAKALGRNRVES